MKLVAAAVALLIAEDARADQLVCTSTKDAATRQAKLAAANTKAREAALAKAGLKAIKVGLAPSIKASGNVVAITVRAGCNDDPAALVQFAVDKSGKKAYRIMPKVTTTNVNIYACGRQECVAPCGMPPEETTLAFKLPDIAVYSGEREIAWAEQVATISYEMPVVCTASGQARTPANPTTGTSELERLRAENATLRAENEQLKIEYEKLKVENDKLKKVERERVKHLQKQMGGSPTTLE